MNMEQDAMNFGPSWQEMLIMSIAGALIVLFGGMIATRAGRAPFWGLLLLVPVVQILCFWIFAFISWPRIDRNDQDS
ncbi:MAG: hypothetical protein ACQEQL_04855 [Pseudomonadota bacterium]